MIYCKSEHRPSGTRATRSSVNSKSTWPSSIQAAVDVFPLQLSNQTNMISFNQAQANQRRSAVTPLVQTVKRYSKLSTSLTTTRSSSFKPSPSLSRIQTSPSPDWSHLTKTAATKAALTIECRTHLLIPMVMMMLCFNRCKKRKRKFPALRASPNSGPV